MLIISSARFLLILAACIVTTWGADPTQPSASVPDGLPQSQKRDYLILKATLDKFDQTLDTLGPEKHAVTFGAEVLPANSNRGEELLKPSTLKGVELYLQRLQEMGVQGATLSINYPILTANFPRFEQYMEFYRKVCAQVRARGLKLAIESGPIFSGSDFSPLQVDYSGLTVERYQNEMREMTSTILRELKPDYFNFGSEPDVASKVMNLKELARPEVAESVVRHVFSGLDKGNTLVGAGLGTWGSLEFVKRYVTIPEIDFIDLHIYPIGRQPLLNAILACRLAKQNGKRLTMQECWLYKTTRRGSGSMPDNARVFSRDAFSYWAPLDQQFLNAMARLARIHGIEYVSPFWSAYFFAYLERPQRLEPYTVIRAEHGKRASENLMAGKLSTTGDFYSSIIRESQ